MKKRLFLGLLVVALAVWGWALFRTGMFQRPAEVVVNMDSSLVVPASLGTLAKNPFRGPWSPTDSVVRPRVVARVAVPAGPTAADSLVKTPKLQGVVGGSPPMAILELDGRTEMVRAGVSVFGWTVEKISADGVDLRHGRLRRHLGP